MTRLTIRHAGCGALMFLVGCTTAPRPLTSASPASSEAPEGAHTPRQTSLRADDMTRKTASLLAAAQKAQEHWDANGPVSGSPVEPPKDNSDPETKHEHH